MPKQKLKVIAILGQDSSPTQDTTSAPLLALARAIGRQMAREYLQTRQDEKKDASESGVIPKNDL